MSQALKAIEGTACTLKLQLDASRTENRRLRDDADASNAKLLGVIEDLNGKLSYYSETVHSHANKRAELENALLQRTKELRAGQPWNTGERGARAGWRIRKLPIYVLCHLFGIRSRGCSKNQTR